MTEVRWIKLATGTFYDDKIRLMEGERNGDTLVLLFLKLLCLAGEKNNNGRFFSGKIVYDEEYFAKILRKSRKTIRKSFAIFEQLGLIQLYPEGLEILNWGKHQSTDKLDQIRESNRLRMQRYRQRLALEANGGPGGGDVTVTLRSNAEPELEKELEGERKEKPLARGAASPAAAGKAGHMAAGGAVVVGGPGNKKNEQAAGGSAGQEGVGLSEKSGNAGQRKGNAPCGPAVGGKGSATSMAEIGGGLVLQANGQHGGGQGRGAKGRAVDCGNAGVEKSAAVEAVSGKRAKGGCGNAKQSHTGPSGRTNGGGKHWEVDVANAGETGGVKAAATAGENGNGQDGLAMVSGGGVAAAGPDRAGEAACLRLFASLKGAACTPFEAAAIRQLIAVDGVMEVQRALEVTGKAGKASLRYTEGVLRRWRQGGREAAVESGFERAFAQAKALLANGEQRHD